MKTPIKQIIMNKKVTTINQYDTLSRGTKCIAVRRCVSLILLITKYLVAHAIVLFSYICVQVYLILLSDDFMQYTLIKKMMVSN